MRRMRRQMVDQQWMSRRKLITCCCSLIRGGDVGRLMLSNRMGRFDNIKLKCKIKLKMTPTQLLLASGAALWVRSMSSQS